MNEQQAEILVRKIQTMNKRWREKTLPQHKKTAKRIAFICVPICLIIPTVLCVLGSPSTKYGMVAVVTGSILVLAALLISSCHFYEWAQSYHVKRKAECTMARAIFFSLILEKESPSYDEIDLYYERHKSTLAEIKKPYHVFSAIGIVLFWTAVNLIYFLTWWKIYASDKNWSWALITNSIFLGMALKKISNDTARECLYLFSLLSDRKQAVKNFAFMTAHYAQHLQERDDNWVPTISLRHSAGSGNDSCTNC